MDAGLSDSSRRLLPRRTLMASSCNYPEREALRPLIEQIFGLVKAAATEKQWADWLRPVVEHAAARGNLELVNTLLEAGATGTPGLRGCRGRTLLDAAAEGGNEKVVLALLRAGARPDVSVRSGSKRRSALHRAALRGHESAARVLMMAGADVASLDSDKRGPLHLAVRAGHEQLVCSLLLGGANPSAKDKKGDAPLHLAAAWRGHASIACALLLKGAEKDALDSRGRSPLHVAAEHGNRGTANALLAAKADVTLRYGENELSALDSAASHGHIGVLKALIQHGMDVNDADSTGYTALHMAADNNEADAVCVLIAAGAEVESHDVHHWTPLHCAARYNGCWEAMAALMKHGADVHARDTAGEYPLHVASLYLADRAVDLLLRSGAKESAINGDGHAPEEIIGVYAPDDDTATEEEREAATHLIRHQLRYAPEDRNWRRRGWIVICRHRSLTKPHRQPPQVQQQQQQQQQQQHDEVECACRRIDLIGGTPAKVPRIEEEASVENGGNGDAGCGTGGGNDECLERCSSSSSSSSSNRSRGCNKKISSTGDRVDCKRRCASCDGGPDANSDYGGICVPDISSRHHNTEGKSDQEYEVHGSDTRGSESEARLGRPCRGTVDGIPCCGDDTCCMWLSLMRVSEEGVFRQIVRFL